MRKCLIIFSLSAKITVETRPGTTSTNISPSTSTPTSPMTTFIPSTTTARISVSISLFALPKVPCVLRNFFPKECCFRFLEIFFALLTKKTDKRVSVPLLESET